MNETRVKTSKMEETTVFKPISTFCPRIVHVPVNLMKSYGIFYILKLVSGLELWLTATEILYIGPVVVRSEKLP